MENLTNLLDTWSQVEPWKKNNNSDAHNNQITNHKNIPLQNLRCQDKSLGISISCPTKLSVPSSSTSTSTNWMILAESNEYPTAQVRIAPSSSAADGTISVGIVLDDGFPVCCQSAEDALNKRKLAAAQEVSMAGGTLNVLKSEINEEKHEALGEWEMASNMPGFPTLLVREKIRVWNGMSVSVSVVSPRQNVPQKDFDLVFEVATSTLNIDHNALRLGGIGSGNGNNNNNNNIERLLIVSHPMNCMLNVPFPRRILLVDGASQRPVEHHAAPALPGTVLTRCINPLTDVCLSLIALPTQDLGPEPEISVAPAATTTTTTTTTTTNNSGISTKKTPHYTRQVRAHFHDGTSIAKIVDGEGGILTFTSPAVGVDYGRLCCAARPIPPRIGADPRMFLVLVASRLFDSQTPGAEELVDRIMKPELIKMISNENVFVSTVPFDIVGKPFKPSDELATKKEIRSALALPNNKNNRPPGCRYFILEGATTSKESTTNVQISSFQSLNSGSAVEFQMPFFGAADNHFSCILTRCVFGDMLAVADGTGTSLVLRSNVMKMLKNKTIDSLITEAKYRAMSIDPATTVVTEKNGNYEILMVTPSEENTKMSSIKNGFHIGRSVAGDSSSCVFSVIVAMVNQQEEHHGN